VEAQGVEKHGVVEGCSAIRERPFKEHNVKSWASKPLYVRRSSFSFWDYATNPSQLPI